MTDHELDTQIDEVAHAMTSAPLDAQLAHRVAAHIAGLDAPREGSRWRRRWILVPAAGLCVLLIAVFLARERDVRLKPNAVVSGFSRTGDSERVALRTTTPLAPSPPIGVAPIVVERLEVAPMALSAIDIKPIAIDRIEISAMP